VPFLPLAIASTTAIEPSPRLYISDGYAAPAEHGPSVRQPERVAYRRPDRVVQNANDPPSAAMTATCAAVSATVTMLRRRRVITSRAPVDIAPARMCSPFKVAARVRIPYGLPRNPTSEPLSGVPRLDFAARWREPSKPSERIAGPSSGVRRFDPRVSVSVGGGEETAALDGQFDVLEARRGNASDSDSPDEQAPLGSIERRRGPRGRPAEVSGECCAVELRRGAVAVADHPQHRHELIVDLGIVDRRAIGHDTVRFAACFAFFAARFCFNDVPDFFDSCCRGDLSAISCSSFR
jgi:hypothetical protein